MDKLFQWLETLGLEEHFQALKDNDIDLGVLPHLTDQDLKDVGLSIGHRRRLLAATAELAGVGQDIGTEASPLSFLPSERILYARGALQGERKQATVLFADIVDSTRLTYGKDADEADVRLSPAIDVMRNAVFRYEGYARPRGDGIQGIFGVPLAHEDHALRGCYAALDILAAVAELNEKLQEETGEFIQVRVGLNSGELLVKGIQDDLLVEIDAIGPMIAVASRMERLTPPGTAQITAATMALVQGFVDVESAGHISVKGIDEPVEAFQLKSARSVSTPFHGKALRGLTRFVGRRREMAALTTAWDETHGSQGRVVMVNGEPGVGKSRLFWEFMHAPRMEGVPIYEASSVSFENANAYGPLINMVRQYFGIQPQDDDRHVRELVSGKLITLDEGLTLYRPAIFDLLGLEADDAKWLSLDPLVRRQRTIEAIGSIVKQEASVQPFCLVFEDLHWTDAETEAVLDSLVAAAADTPVLLLLNHRPEYVNRWNDKNYVSTLSIGPLPDESVEALLDSLLGRSDKLWTLKEHLIDITDGNPFFLEETVQMLRELKIIDGRPGMVELSRPITDIEVPASVQSTLAARMDRLHPDTKELLHYAAVSGKTAQQAVLAKAIDLSDTELLAGLDKLQAAEFLFRTDSGPKAEYSFKHALTHQVAYHTLPKSRRQEIHTHLLRAMEQVFAYSLTEHFEQLAHHAMEGEQWEEAARYGFLAGRKAYDRSANADAVNHLEKALQVSVHLPKTEDLMRLELDVRFLLRQALLNLGHTEQIGKLLEDTKPLLDALDDRARAGKFEAFRSNYFHLVNDQPKALEHGELAMAHAEAGRDRTLAVEVSYRNAQAHYQMGNFRKAIAYCEHGLELLGTMHELDRLGIAAIPAVICRTWLCHSFCELGDLDQALASAERAVEIADKSDHPLSIVFSRWASGHVNLRRRAYGQALVECQRGLEVCDFWKLRGWLPRLASSVGILHAMAGRFDGAMEVLQDAIRLTIETGYAVDEPLLRNRLAKALMLAGALDEAKIEANAALKLSRDCKAMGQYASNLRLLGEIELRSFEPNLARASGHVGEALKIARSLSMRPLMIACLETIASLSVAGGQPDAAIAAEQQAASLSREIGLRTDGLNQLRETMGENTPPLSTSLLTGFISDSRVERPYSRAVFRAVN